MIKNILKIALVVSVIILVSAGCAKKQVKQEPQVLVKETVTTEEVKPSGQTQAQTKQNAGGADYKPQTESASLLTLDQKVEGSNIINTGFPFTEGQTAYDVLSATHKVEAKDYGAMGKFVQSIDGVKAGSGHFWEFWINGKSSNVGASSYKLQNGDKLEWKLTVIK